MMFGFGDSHQPNPDTVHLVEQIVLNQLRLIVQEALKFAEGKTLGGEELVFLMRKNKQKMQRFVKYLLHKDLKKKAESSVVDLTEPVKNPLLEYIGYIDETGELTDVSEFDEVKYQRQVRADRMSQALNEEQYMKFFNARCMSFNSKSILQSRNFEKLRLWVDPKKEVNFTTVGLDVLSYYAYETVAEIVDCAFLVRLDSRHTDDPLANLDGMYYTAAMFNGEHKLANAQDYSKVYSGQPPISVNEVKEVMRRLYMPNHGKLCLGRKLPDSQYILAI